MLCVTAGCAAAPQRLGVVDETQTGNPPVGPGEEEMTNAAAPRHCSQLPPNATSGVYHFLPEGPEGLEGPKTSIPTYCQVMPNGDKWTVFQRRNSSIEQEDFNREMKAYKNGFGNLAGEFWWGLVNISRATSAQDCKFELRVEVACNGTTSKSIIYEDFRVTSEGEGFSLSAVSPMGDAGDGLRLSIDKKFSARDSADAECSNLHQSGWWFNTIQQGCANSNPNGVRGAQNGTGIYWDGLTDSSGQPRILKMTAMMLRPVMPGNTGGGGISVTS